jgi:peptide/nickel transport system substrate-binding protein
MLDQNKRKEIYGQLQVMIAEEAGTIIPAYIAGVDAVTAKLKGMEINPLGGMMGYSMAEHVWFAA